MDSYWQLALTSGLGAALITAVAMHLALIPWRKSIGAHWTERARLLWPARRVMAGVIFACIISAIILPRLFGLPGDDSASFWPVIPGYLAASFVSTREIEPRYRFLTWLHEMFWQVLVQFGMLAIFIWLLHTMPQVMQPRDWLRFSLGTLAVIVIITGVWLPLLYLFLKAKKSPDLRLERLVDEMAAQTSIKPWRVYYGESPLARAAALIYLRSLVFTSRVLEVLTDDELRSIILHELAHLRESLAVRLSRLIPVLALMLITFIHPVMHQFGILGLYGLIGIVFLLLKLAKRIARRMEHHADDAAIQGSVDPAIYARALEKIYQANQLPAVMRGNNMVHPHLYDRMLAAGVTPDYPRPQPPGRMAWPGWAAFLVPCALFAWMVLRPHA
ncbi:MAG: M56 family metallopeptidase [Prosthecobacter sp.]|nr:M56 family metallopeptidase [Prosthecobacter sp.]